MGQNRLNVILGVDLTQLQKSLRQAERKLSRFSRNVGRAGEELTRNLSLPLAAVGGASLKAFGELEKLEKGMEAITGSSQEAALELERLRRIAEQPGLAFDQAVKGSIQLQAVGFNATAARESISALAKAVALTGGSAQELGQVVRQITQINSKGRILQEDFQVIAENAPAIGIALKKAFNTTNIQAIRETGISTAEFSRRLIEGINNAEEFQNVQGGLANAFENFRNNTRFAAAELGRTIAETIDLESVMNKLSKAIGRVVGFFKSLTPEARKVVIVIAAVAVGIGPLLLVIGKLVSFVPLMIKGFSSIISIVKGAGAAFAFLTSPIGAIAGLIVGLIATLTYLYNRFEGVRRIVNGVIDGFFELLRVLRDIGKAIALFAAALFQFSTGQFGKAGKNIEKAMETIDGLNIGKRIGGAFVQGFMDGSNRLEKGLDSIKSKIFSISKGVTSEAKTGTSDLLVSNEGFAIDSGAPTSGAGTVGEDVKPIRAEFGQLAKLDNGALEVQGNIAEDTQLKIQSLAESYSVLNQKIGETTTAIQLSGEAYNTTSTAIAAITSTIGDVATGAATALSNAAASGEASFAALGKAALAGAAQVVKANIVAAVTSFAKDAFAKLGILGAPLAIAAGGIVGGIFNGLIGRIGLPKLAEGGVIPPGFPNDTYPALLTSGETVFPPGELPDLSKGGDNGYIAETQIRGEDLLILLRRAEQALNRFS